MSTRVRLVDNIRSQHTRGVAFREYRHNPRVFNPVFGAGFEAPQRGCEGIVAPDGVVRDLDSSATLLAHQPEELTQPEDCWDP